MESAKCRSDAALVLRGLREPGVCRMRHGPCADVAAAGCCLGVWALMPLCLTCHWLLVLTAPTLSLPF